MNDNAIRVREPDLNLPSGAPLVRITAGLGSAGQKTWNLRRPVTLVGSRRPAHIVLHDRDINKAHCVIVNTGQEVLLKDLHTESGTLCNDEAVDLALLKDGDTLTIGATRIQVAIRDSDNGADDSGCGMQYCDPMQFPKPVRVRLVHAEHQWEIQEAVAVIGTQEGAAIQLDHQDVSHRHVVLFKFAGSPAVFDLGSRAGLWVNGERSSLARIEDGDTITVGPFGLSIHTGSVRATSPATGAPSGDQEVEPEPGQPTRPLSEIESELTTLHDSITNTWERLNSWQSQVREGLTDDAGAEVPDRAAALEAKDAELRGKLHDVECLHEDMARREQDLARDRARLQADQDALMVAQRALQEREKDFETQAAELQRRENALAQRWTRLRSATCPNCGKPLRSA